MTIVSTHIISHPLHKVYKYNIISFFFAQVVTLKDITNLQTNIVKPDESLEAVVGSLRRIEDKLCFSRKSSHIPHHEMLFACLQYPVELHAELHI